MLITGRRARAVLESAGLNARHARAALSCGLAGAAIRTTAAHLYDEERVRELADRPEIDWGAGGRACRRGLFVCRRDIDVTLPREELLALVSGGWDAVNAWQMYKLTLHVRAHGSFPFVATVAGFVVLGADIVATPRGNRFVLRSPGSWFDLFEDRRLPQGPGRPWVLYLGPLTQADLSPAR